MKYSLPFTDLPTSSTINEKTTLAALIVPATVGYRFRLRALIIGFSKDTPDDQPVAITIQRISDLSGGTAGTSTAVSTVNIPKKDPSSIDSLVPGARAYSLEPTVYDPEVLFADEINDRGGIIKEWDEEGAPRFTQDMLCGLVAAPRQAIEARVSGTLEFELF